MNGELTVEEQNLIKDVLKVIGNDEELNTRFPKSLEQSMSQEQWDTLCDSIFAKLQNGRVTIKQG
jgi:hypothetical protein